MINANKIILSYFAVFLLFFSNKILAQNWVEKHNENGITAYINENPENKELKEIKIITYINSDINIIKNLILDDYSNENTMLSKILSENNNLIFVYNQVDMPWPVQDKDIVIKKEVKLNLPDKIIITEKSVPDYTPQNKKFARVNIANGTWELTLLKNGKVKLEYFFYTDSGNNFPDWLIDMFIINTPIQRIEKINYFANQNISETD